jgi:thiol-disulfide isomerase/thioredoxin
MKTVYLLAGWTLTAALLLSGCQRETDFDSPAGRPVDILLTVDETKTVNDGMSTHWSSNDKLSAFYAPSGTTSYSGNTPFYIEDPETGIATGDAALTGGKYDWYLLYPYTADVESPAEKEETHIQIGRVMQTQTGNDSMAHLAGRNMPLYGVARCVPAEEIPTVAMHQAAAVAAVNVTNGTDQPLDVRKITLTAPCDIVGYYSLDLTNGEPVYTTHPDKLLVYKYVILSVKDPAPIPAGESARFYLALRPFSLSAGNKLTLEVEGGTTPETISIAKEITLSDAVSFKAGHIKNLNFSFAPEDKILVVGDVATVPAEGGIVEIPVQSNVNYSWEIEDSAKSWIHFLRTRSIQNKTLEFKVDANSGDERRGNVTFWDEDGGCDPVTVTVVQESFESPEESRIREALMEIYNAMDGPNWQNATNWGDAAVHINQWNGVTWNRETRELELRFFQFGLKGEFPDCFEGLSACTFFSLVETGVTGTLPPSFNKLKSLKNLILDSTSMTSLSDVFAGIPLETVFLSINEQMTGPLPETLGESPALTRLEIGDCNFTGTVPDSWAGLGLRLILNHLPGLSGRVPDSFVTADDAAYLINMYLHEATSGKIMSVGDYDIPAYWPKRGARDIVTGKPIPYHDIVSRNKATVLLVWGAWCPYSKELVPILKRMYEKYHDAGLEIIACQKHNANEEAEIAAGKKPESYILERGYESWYNFVAEEFLSDMEYCCWTDNGIPSARVVDRNGNILYCGLKEVSDPARNRFGYTASTTLISVLENLFGPLEEDGDYESTDYSRDGEVMTLQTATVGKGINIVFLGDAYTDKDMGQDGLYERMMKASMEEFFAIEPYKTFRNRFNAYAVKVVSKHGKTGTGYTTALGSVMADGSAITGNSDKCFEYALKVPGIKDTRNLVISVLVNSINHGGVTTMSESQQSGIAFTSSIGNSPEAFGPTLRHEAGGHGFAFLADEYAVHNTRPDQEFIDYFRRLYAEYGWAANVDFTDDPQNILWSAFLSDERYKDEVGIYEGACNVLHGAWRPSKDSMMNQQVEYFNAPSRHAIYKRIMELSGEGYSFGKFLEYDAVNRGGTKAAPRPPLKAAAERPHSLENLAPPVIIP